MKQGLLATAFVALFCASSHAHDFWIETTTYRPEVDRPVGVRLFIGHLGEAEPFPRDGSHLIRLLAKGPRGEIDLPGLSGSTTVGYLRPSHRGLYVIGYLSHPRSITLEPKKFNQYLRDKGLARIAKIRADRGETRTEGRELYTRYAKSLIQTRGGSHQTPDRRLGFALELLAETNPYALSPGEEFRVRILFQGSPLQGAQIAAESAHKPGLRDQARSDREGRVRFRLSRPGLWLIESVHMVEATPPSQDQWESFWASLTFELPSPSTPTKRD